MRVSFTACACIIPRVRCVVSSVYTVCSRGGHVSRQAAEVLCLFTACFSFHRTEPVSRVRVYDFWTVAGAK